jgi:hypothetical protein
MIRTDKAILLDAAQREPRASMTTQIAPGLDLLANTPQDQIFS